jgi:hypothetical protein
MSMTATASKIENLRYEKSTFSIQGACVEVAPTGDGVAVRDSKGVGEGPVLRFNRAEWVAFVQGIRAGQFDYDFFDRV